MRTDDIFFLNVRWLLKDDKIMKIMKGFHQPKYTQPDQDKILCPAWQQLVYYIINFFDHRLNQFERCCSFRLNSLK